MGQGTWALGVGLGTTLEVLGAGTRGLVQLGWYSICLAPDADQAQKKIVTLKVRKLYTQPRFQTSLFVND